MATKVCLSDAMVEQIIAQLQQGDFEQRNDAKYIPRATAIYVNEDWDAVKVTWGYVYPGRPFAPRPTAFFDITVGELTFKIDDGGCCELGEWSLESDCYSMPDNVDVLNKLTSALNSHLDLDFDPLHYLDEYAYENEWTEDEIAEEIEDQLEYERYIYVDGLIFPYDECDSVEEWFDLNAECLEDIEPSDVQPPKKLKSYEEHNYCLLKPKEVAKFLSKQELEYE